MPFPISLTQENYEALVALARKGVANADESGQLEQFLISIESANGITRHLLWVQWQDPNTTLQPTVRFPEVWPPELRTLVQRTDRPISLADVNAALASKVTNPTNILVTQDPAAQVGWTKLNDFFAR